MEQADGETSGASMYETKSAWEPRPNLLPKSFSKHRKNDGTTLLPHKVGLSSLQTIWLCEGKRQARPLHPNTVVPYASSTMSSAQSNIQDIARVEALRSTLQTLFPQMLVLPSCHRYRDLYGHHDVPQQRRSTRSRTNRSYRETRFRCSNCVRVSIGCIISNRALTRFAQRMRLDLHRFRGPRIKWLDSTFNTNPQADLREVGEPKLVEGNLFDAKIEAAGCR